MKIAFFEIEDWEKDYLKTRLAEHELFFYLEQVSSKNISKVSNTHILSTFIYSQLSAELLSRFPSLKLITTRSTGFDHIDIAYCQKNGITVCNVPTYGVDTIAEHTFALILALSRKIIPSIEKTRKGDLSLEGLRGFELAGKTLGIVGFGHIGKRVAEIARCFHLNVLVTSRHPDEKLAQQHGVTFVDLSTLLSSSDIISLHVPLNKETTHLINKENIRLVKRGAILINTARGAVAETEAIVWALEQRILGAAALDVLDEECVLKEERELLTKEFLKTCDLKTQLLNHVLLTKENVIITPHNAFNSNEALQEILETTISNITEFATGKPINQL